MNKHASARKAAAQPSSSRVGRPDSGQPEALPHAAEMQMPPDANNDGAGGLRGPGRLGGGPRASASLPHG